MVFRTPWFIRQQSDTFEKNYQLRSPPSANRGPLKEHAVTGTNGALHHGLVFLISGPRPKATYHSRLLVPN